MENPGRRLREWLNVHCILIVLFALTHACRCVRNSPPQSRQSKCHVGQLFLSLQLLSNLVGGDMEFLLREGGRNLYS